MNSNEQYIIRMMEAAVKGVLKGCDASEVMEMPDYTKACVTGWKLL